MEQKKKKDVKKQLRQWGEALDQCREKIERAEDLRRLCDETRDLKSIRYSVMPKTSSIDSHVEKIVIKTIDVYEKAIDEIESEIENIMEMKAHVDGAVNLLENEEQKIIYLRYRDGLSWDYIPDIIHKSRMQCFRIHNRVIDKMCNML